MKLETGGGEEKVKRRIGSFCFYCWKLFFFVVFLISSSSCKSFKNSTTDRDCFISSFPFKAGARRMGAGEGCWGQGRGFKNVLCDVIIGRHLAPTFWRARRLADIPGGTPLPSGVRRRSRPSARRCSSPSPPRSPSASLHQRPTCRRWPASKRV